MLPINYNRFKGRSVKVHQELIRVFEINLKIKKKKSNYGIS